MTEPRARYIPDLLQQHLQELEYLWARRRTALASRELTVRDYADLNERVEAHIQGVLAVPAALPELMTKFAGEERDAIFAAACPLLRFADRAMVQAVVDVFAKAEGAVLIGLRDALSMAYSNVAGTAVLAQFENADPVHAAAAAVVLANHRLLTPAAPRLTALLGNDDAAIAELAWLAATIADACDPSAIPARPFRQALQSESAHVRSAALRAAAWTSQSWTLPAVREFAEQGDRAALNWLAVLGAPEDFAAFSELALKLENVEERCQLLARFGHPAALDMVASWLEAEDATAAAAGEAFTRMTGADIRGQRKTLEPPPDADDFAKEFAPDVWLPDVAKARAYLSRFGSIIASGTRWRAGKDVGGQCSQGILARVDLEARWDLCARAALAGAPIVPPPPIH